MQNIRMVDLESQYLRIKSEIDGAVQKVLHSTAFIQGPEVKMFAEALGRYVDSPYVIPCGNGTDALQIAMMALGFKPGDEVILPVHTYVATAEVIALLGLTPVFVDVDPDHFNIDVAAIASKITDRTVAIVPVHLYGQCADMEQLMHIARKNNLHVIEDVAQALGARYTFKDGTTKHAGTMGVIGTTSFFPTKNLGCFGDGGAIFTADPKLAERISMTANHGQRVKYHHDLIGVNSRLDTLQAAVLNVKLRYLDDYANRRNSVAEFYDGAFHESSFLKIPRRAVGRTHVFHQYTLKVAGGRRDAFRKHLEQHGVPSMIYYPVPLHLQQAYRRDSAPKGTFPVTEALSEQVISLPIHTEMTSQQLQYIADVVKKFDQV